MKIKFKYLYFFIIFISFPYELTFTYFVKNFSFLNFITRGKNYDYEPFPLNLIADLHYDILFENANYTSFIYFLPIFYIFITNSLIKEGKYKSVGNLNDFITSYLPYFIMNFIFYRLYFYYCKFSKPIETVSICEQTDNYFFFSVMFLFIFFIFFKPKYCIQSSRSSLIFALLLLTYNLLGSGFIFNYPGIYVHYQDIFRFDSSLILLISFLILNYLRSNKLLFRLVILLLSLTLYFKSVLPAISIILFFITFKRFRNNVLRIYEIIFSLYLLISISFSSLTYVGSWDTHDLINEFYSFALTPSFIDYFPQYNYLLPLLVKPIILQFSDVIYQFNLLMSVITFISLGLILKVFQNISKTNYLLYVIIFFGFGINFYSINNQLLPSDTDLLNGNTESLLNTFQTIPLRIYMYSIFSFTFIKYLKNKERNIINLFLYFLLIFSSLDNPFVGLCLSVSFLGFEFISNNGFSNFRIFITKNWFLILFNLLFLHFIFFNSQFKHMYLFINSSGFTDAWYLQYHYSGFHIFSLIMNLIIFVFCIQKLNSQTFNEDKLKVEFLIYNSIFVFSYFIYFIGRSHPKNLYIILIPLLISFVIFFDLIKNNKDLKLIRVVLLLIFASGISQIKYTPSIFQYYDDVYLDEINLQYLDLETNEKRSNNIQVDPYLDREIINELGDSNVLLFSRFGSIVSHMNSISGYSPLISNVIFSDYQCTKLLEIINKPINDYVLISRDSYVLQSYYNKCFGEEITPLLENTNFFRLSYQNEFYNLYSKIEND